MSVYKLRRVQNVKSPVITLPEKVLKIFKFGDKVIVDIVEAREGKAILRIRKLKKVTKISKAWSTGKPQIKLPNEICNYINIGDLVSTKILEMKENEVILKLEKIVK